MTHTAAIAEMKTHFMSHPNHDPPLPLLLRPLPDAPALDASREPGLAVPFSFDLVNDEAGCARMSEFVETDIISWLSDTSPVRAENPRKGDLGNVRFFRTKQSDQSSHPLKCSWTSRYSSRTNVMRILVVTFAILKFAEHAPRD